MRETEGIYLIGAGGHAKVILALLEALGRKCLGIYDDNALLSQIGGGGLYSIPVIGAVKELPDSSEISAFIAIGDNAARRQIAQRFSRVRWVSLVHPHSWVHKSAVIQEGAVIMTGAIVHPDTTIGAHSIVNTAATIDHDCRIGSFCHIAPGCHICGGVSVGDNSFLGVGASVIPNVSIAPNTIIGAGSVVIRDIAASGTYVGVPAHAVKE